jgi:hypothetical protein
MSHVGETEDAELREALHQSALEYAKQDQLQNKPMSSELEVLLLSESIDLPALSAADADTLVYFGVPPQQADQDYDTYNRISRHFAVNPRIHSKNVLSSGSAKLEKLLGPSSQFRTERRLRNQGIFTGGKPHGIKYLLDLRPPSEDDDAIFLLTELSCSPGILTWFKAQEKYDIPRTMVCGQDDATSLSKSLNLAARIQKQSEPGKKAMKPVVLQKSEADSSVTQPAGNDDSSRNKDPKRSRVGNWAGEFPALPAIPNILSDKKVEVDAAAEEGKAQEPLEFSSDDGVASEPVTQEVDTQSEYSQLRHFSAIERLLRAIEGLDPLLDSAPKLWTFFAVASYFGCASNERISGWITKWLFTAPNNNFIQCNPEVCYRIALGIRSETLLKDAFSVLVGEKALINIRRDHSNIGNMDLTVSVAGRKLGLLDEDELGRISHAANSFAKRIQSRYAALVGQDMQWLQRSAIFRVLDGFVANSIDEEAIAWQLKEGIKKLVRTRILWVMVRDYQGDGAQKEQFPDSVRSFYPHASAHFSIYNKLNPEERVFTRLFWTALKVEKFEAGANSIYTRPLFSSNDEDLNGWMAPSPIEGWSKLAQKMKYGGEHNLVKFHKNKLFDMGAKFMDILSARNSSQTLQGSYLPLGWAKVRHLASNAGSRIPNREDATDDGVSKGKAVSQSSLQQFETSQLSSPNQTPEAGPATDLGDENRARVDLDRVHGSDQANRIQTDLPFRAAPTQSKNTAESSKSAKASSSFRDVGNFQGRFPYRETKASIADEYEASGSTSDTARNLFGSAFSANFLANLLEQENDEDERLSREHNFPVHQLLREISQAAHGICDEVLLAVHLFQDKEVPPTTLIDTLMCLDDREWRFLPLWAGGNDDGTGGVFNDLDLPTLEQGGFAGGRRWLGEQQASSISGSSDWSEILSTVGRASKDATDGTATETATVQSIGDVDMDVRSLDDDSVTGDDGNVVDLAVNSAENRGGDNEEECDVNNEQDQEDSDMEMEHMDTDDVEGEWDDCLE